MPLYPNYRVALNVVDSVYASLAVLAQLIDARLAAQPPDLGDLEPTVVPTETFSAIAYDLDWTGSAFWQATANVETYGPAKVEHGYIAGLYQAVPPGSCQVPTKFDLFGSDKLEWWAAQHSSVLQAAVSAWCEEAVVVQSKIGQSVIFEHCMQIFELQLTIQGPVDAICRRRFAVTGKGEIARPGSSNGLELNSGIISGNTKPIANMVGAGITINIDRVARALEDLAHKTTVFQINNKGAIADLSSFEILTP
jgi:hypothetical protein